MRGRSLRRTQEVLLVAGLAAGCADGPTQPSDVIEIAAPASTEVVVGDLLTLSASGTDPLASQVWSATPASVATAQGGVIEALRPGTVEVVVRAGDAADTLTLTVLARENGYTADEVDYFLEIALGFEFGTASPIVRKWAQDVRYHVSGSPTPEDLETLAEVATDINALTSTVDLVAAESGSTVEVHFGPESTFRSLLPSYVPGNIGFFTVTWGADQHLNSAVVLIASDQPQGVRDHLIREEVTQMLGMARDSFRYPDSIFQQAYTLVTEYAPIDEAVIEILYRPELIVGMDESAAGRAARRLVRGVLAGAPAPMRADGRRVVPDGGSGSSSASR